MAVVGLAAALTATLVVGPATASPAGTAATTGTRDPLQWPYARTSIWNTPIGSDARYVPARIRSRSFGVDTDWFVVTKRTDPRVATYMPGSFGEGRCRGRAPQQQAPWHPEARRPQNVPRGLVIPDAVTRGGVHTTPNNSSAFLQPNGRTLVSYDVTARCRRGGPLHGQWFGESSLFGDGIAGGHGGSGMSSIGGSIRTGELLGALPIRHALKVDVWGRYLFHDAATGGRRWPARLADSGAAQQYTGRVKALRMGALLAIPPTTTATRLGLRTAVGRKLFAALRDYGAYVVDDSGHDSTYLCVERRAVVQYRKATGHDIDDDPALQRDMARMMAAVAVVDDNRPGTVGGAGARRAPLAPAFRAAGTPPATKAAAARTGRTTTGRAPATISSRLAAERAEPEALGGSTVWLVAAVAAALLATGGWLGRRVTRAGRRSG
jgi:hypothetical protein